MDFNLIYAFILLAAMGFLAVLWLWALIDILRSNFSGMNKIIWLLLIIFIPLLGMILYFAIGKKQKISPLTNPPDKSS
ncbi:MAG TPA: PLDc N-terminal domain-containing protein [Syntrophorhabdaceae bacterium]|nr:PLDc N-terminal domain-containing protein [Syntrophorhabdaceae bacterium]